MNFQDILFVSDYDNTMTGERHLVPEENLEAIREFTSRGGAFTLASGRGKREWYPSFHDVPFNAPLILSNGATIYDTKADRILYHALLTEEQKALAEKLFLSLPPESGGSSKPTKSSTFPKRSTRPPASRASRDQTRCIPPLRMSPQAGIRSALLQAL